MKKVLFVVLMALFSISLFSQSENHLRFKDIPINGSLSNFISELNKIGFTTKKTKGDITILDGVFVNRRCELYVVVSPKTKTVWKVVIDLPESDSWYTLKSDYEEYKELFINKYGEPSDNFESFYEPYYEGDGYELQALRKEKCTYASFFRVNGGSVFVEINAFGCIQFGYEDKINSDISKKEINDINANDI